METNFCALLAALDAGCDWTIAFKKRGDKITFAMLPVFVQDKDPAMKKIIPFRMTGTAEMIDKALYEKLQVPAAKALELTTNNMAVMASIEQARKRSRAEEERKSQQAKEQKSQQERFDATMKKTDELAQAGKYGEAIAVLQKATDLSAFADKITARIEELRSKHPQLSLL